MAFCSDSNNNTFYIDCPNVNTFNTTLSNITIQDIYAPNATLIIEDYTADEQEALPNADPLATSFKVEGNGFLENISLHIVGGGGGAGNIQVYLLNSTWESSQMRSKPDDTISVSNKIGDMSVPNGGNGWFDLNLLHEPLDNSKTENNTWFIAVNGGGSFQQLYWYYTNDWSSGVGTTD